MLDFGSTGFFAWVTNPDKSESAKSVLRLLFSTCFVLRSVLWVRAEFMRLREHKPLHHLFQTDLCARINMFEKLRVVIISEM